MDPVTHALAGAAAARVAAGRSLKAAAMLPGAVGALLPDADALIRSSADPLLYAEFHRNFTHSLAFIPVGGFVATLPWLLRRTTRQHWRAYAVASTAGYATHGVLDAATTYGTMLWWPLTSMRVSWDAIAIVDPLFTLLLALGLAAALWRRIAWPAAVSLVLGVMYVMAGAHARDRALVVQQQIATLRGHTIDRGAVFPAFASNVLWRSLYRADGTLHMDRIRVPWAGVPAWKPGTSVRAVALLDFTERARTDSRLAHDISRFNWFTDAWMARAPDDARLIGDARYSQRTDRFEPVWGIRLDVPGPVPIEWIDRSGDRGIDPRELWNEIRGADPGYRALDPDHLQVVPTAD